MCFDRWDNGALRVINWLKMYCTHDRQEINKWKYQTSFHLKDCFLFFFVSLFGYLILIRMSVVINEPAAEVFSGRNKEDTRPHTERDWRLGIFYLTTGENHWICCIGYLIAICFFIQSYINIMLYFYVMWITCLLTLPVLAVNLHLGCSSNSFLLLVGLVE